MSTSYEARVQLMTGEKEEDTPISSHGKLHKMKKLCTRYSVSGDSILNNFIRNVWRNSVDLANFTYYKVTEQTNISQSQRKNLRYDIIDLYKTVEEDPITLSAQVKRELETKDVCTRIVGYFLLEQTWLLLMLLGIFSAIMSILLDFTIKSFIHRMYPTINRNQFIIHD